MTTERAADNVVFVGKAKTSLIEAIDVLCAGSGNAVQ